MPPYNTTGTEDGGGNGWDPQVIVAFTTAMCSAAASLLTFAYVKLAHSMRDQQESIIELSSTTKTDGGWTTTLVIHLKNEETYSAQGTYMTNDKGDATTEVITAVADVTTAYLQPNANNANIVSNTTSRLSAEPGNFLNEGIQTFMQGNNIGDQIIGNTRNHVTRDALNALLKIEKMHMVSVGRAEADNVLQVGSIFSHTHRGEKPPTKASSTQTSQQHSPFNYTVQNQDEKKGSEPQNVTPISLKTTTTKASTTPSNDDKAQGGQEKVIKQKKKPAKMKDTDVAGKVDDLEHEEQHKVVKKHVQHLPLPKIIAQASKGSLSDQAPTDRDQALTDHDKQGISVVGDNDYTVIDMG